MKKNTLKAIAFTSDMPQLSPKIINWKKSLAVYQTLPTDGVHNKKQCIILRHNIAVTRGKAQHLKTLYHTNEDIAFVQELLNKRYNFFSFIK